MNNKSKKEELDNSEVEEHILKRYSLKEFKGKGAYGIVWKATDLKYNQVVALKKVILYLQVFRCFPKLHRCSKDF